MARKYLQTFAFYAIEHFSICICDRICFDVSYSVEHYYVFMHRVLKWNTQASRTVVD